MFFKNKSTGLVWEVIHSDHIKRCQNDDNYEEVKVQSKKETEEVETKKPSRTIKKKAGEVECHLKI